MEQRFLKLGIIALLVILVSCKKNSSDPEVPSGPVPKEVKASISTALAGKDSLSMYNSLFSNVEFNNDQVTDGITLFAPVNKAFTSLSANAQAKLASVTIAALPSGGTMLPDSSDVKDYMVKGRITSGMLTNGNVLTTLSGKKLTITVLNGHIYLNGVLVSGINIASGTNYVLFTLAGFINDSKLLKITSLSDNTALPGWLLTINGQNFSTALTNNVVKINGTQAIVHTATADQLVVTVPSGVSSGNVTVTVNGKNASGAQRLNIMQATVTSITQITTLKPGPVQSVTLDANDNLFFTDNYMTPNGNHLIPFVRRFDNGGSGTGYSYSPKYPNPNNDGTELTAFGDKGLWAITLDKQNNVYATSLGGVNTYPGVFKFSTATPAIAEWWAGSGILTDGVLGEKHSIRFSIGAMKFDNAGNLIYGNNIADDRAGLMKISANGIASTIASPARFRDVDPTVSKSPNIIGLDFDNAGNFYVGDEANKKIWKVSAGGNVSLLAGNTNAIAKDGIGVAAQFGAPFGLVLDKRGNIYVCDNDYINNSFLIRMINPMGVVTTIAGKMNSSNIIDGIGRNAGFNGVNSIAIDSKGVLYVGCDEGGVRKITIEVPPGQ